MHAMCRAKPERLGFLGCGGRWPVSVGRKALRWAPVVKTWSKFVDKLSAALVLQYNVHNA